MPLPAAAIVGIGSTEFSKNSGRSEMRLAVEACLSALTDAGLSAGDVDGLVTFSIDNNDEAILARNLGVDALSFFARTSSGGGGAPGTLALASMAIATGKASTVICYRAMNERSGQRFGQPSEYVSGTFAKSGAIERSFAGPFGMVTPLSWMAHSAQRYMFEYGATSEDFGRQAVIQREFAVNNPDAFFYQRPITLDDHQNSRLVADPLRLLDCCQESDGAVALVITSVDRAADLPQLPVTLLGSAMGSGSRQTGMAPLYRDDITCMEETKIVGAQLWAQSGLGRNDIDLAILYDHFGPAVLMQLEALGFCGAGEAPGFIRDGGTRLDGALPTNTNGGQLSEAYLHGFNGLLEAVRQLRGTAINQVPGAAHAVVTGGSHVPTSGVLLGRAA
ncbi:lipid-transfer protein [Mycobacterium sp. 48b]|uniref:lipid-transfer protein n=1 Tax=Mycobacterium sp. 48b TaxID=3400426 RepID=UPI003AAA3C11